MGLSPFSESSAALTRKYGQLFEVQVDGACTLFEKANQ
ncbi:hypothetical protein PSE_1289 [Pseudovibrio sp. FO-BEG1]|nr:hypothetical protein PSE_1289 [Pseudovibrio sp. FO-BEG1]